ncbi:hypothetical protein L208DRAFT_98892 [Tricholoma matsutake]|nr:hypothetical protein L208DRAFT_98892 [Tricholoma matsutake 945]
MFGKSLMFHNSMMTAGVLGLMFLTSIANLFSILAAETSQRELVRINRGASTSTSFFGSWRFIKHKLEAEAFIIIAPLHNS